MDQDADIDAILGAFDPEPLIFNGVTVNVVPMEEDRSLSDGDGSSAIIRELSVKVRHSAIPTIKRGSTVTFRSATMRVVNLERYGRMALLFLGAP